MDHSLGAGHTCLQVYHHVSHERRDGSIPLVYLERLELVNIETLVSQPPIKGFNEGIFNRVSPVENAFWINVK